MVGVITTKELGTLTMPETDYGGVVPIASMGDRGVGSGFVGYVPIASMGSGFVG